MGEHCECLCVVIRRFWRHPPAGSSPRPTRAGVCSGSCATLLAVGCRCPTGASVDVVLKVPILVVLANAEQSKKGSTRRALEFLSTQSAMVILISDSKQLLNDGQEFVKVQVPPPVRIGVAKLRLHHLSARAFCRGISHARLAPRTNPGTFLGKLP